MDTSSSMQRRKKELREKMLALRRALSATMTKTMAVPLCDRICAMPEYIKARRIMAFLSMPGEANLDPWIERAMKEGKEIYIPVCLPEHQMEAGRLMSMEHFREGPLGLRSLPKGYEVILPEAIDLVLVPAVAFGSDGGRLGMGAGYYDRFLWKVDYSRRIGCVWDFQVVDSVPQEDLDQPVAAVVTEKRLIRAIRS